LAGVGDSLDLVVIGGYIGKGKRTGAYGGFLLASYNQDTGEYETTCKIGTGFSDEDLVSIHAKLKPSEISQPKPYFVYDTTNSNAKPDVWFDPSMIFEVLTADLSLSPIYKAGHQQYGKGISLRFPRFLRIRDDKGIEDSTSSSEVAEFYERQASVN
jgi:ATP-dependent DNA ligase